MLEENLECLACFHTDAILCIIKTLEQLRIDLLEALTLHVCPHELKQALEEDNRGESEIVGPVIVKR